MDKSNWYRGKYPPSLMIPILIYFVLEKLGYVDEYAWIYVQDGVIYVCVQEWSNYVEIRGGCSALSQAKMIDLLKCFDEETISAPEMSTLLNQFKIFSHVLHILYVLESEGFTRHLPDYRVGVDTSTYHSQLVH